MLFFGINFVNMIDFELKENKSYHKSEVYKGKI